VYGPRQGLSNPYSGCITLFIARLLKNEPPLIFEDGKQVRDFIYVKDVARATALALVKDTGVFLALNVGTGKPMSISEVAEKLAKLTNKRIKPLITNRYRMGDVRNCYVDITKMKLFGFKPLYTFERGLQETLDWVCSQS
jgi:dTDP-L-rhamnose 4-epimerase